MDWRGLGENPLLLRAYRVGFRRGTGSFRLRLWGTILALVVAMDFIGEFADGEMDDPLSFWRKLLRHLLYFNGAVFAFGGLQQVLSFFGRERERGTFEFLHLSTMTPRAIIIGFLLAGNIPGILFLLLTFPGMLVSAQQGGVGIGALLLLLSALIGYVLFFGLFFLHLGFWLRRASDVRGLLILFLLLLLVGSTVTASVAATAAGSTSLMTIGRVLSCVPVLRDLWIRSLGFAGTDAPFLGMNLPIALHAALLLAPIGVVQFFSLAGNVRHRERRPLNDLLGLLLVVPIQFYMLAHDWGGAGSFMLQSTLFLAFSWVLITWLVVHRNLRTAVDMVRLGYGAHGRKRGLVFRAQSPPYLLVGALAASSVAASVLIRISHVGDAGAQWLALLGTPLALILYFLAMQLLEWRGNSTRAWGFWGQALLVWLPLGCWLMIAPLVEFASFVVGITLAPGAAQLPLLVSPLVQAAMLADRLAPASSPGSVPITIALLVAEALAIVWLLRSHREQLLSFLLQSAPRTTLDTGDAPVPAADRRQAAF